MAQIAGRRMTAEVDGDFVVFLIGARPTKLRLLRSMLDLGGRRGMKHMLDYLVAHPEKGLLGYQMGLPVIVQYWRSFEHLEAFAKAPPTRIWRCGATTGVASARATARASGTRPSRSGPASMRPSTATCPPSGSARSAVSFLCLSPRALASASRRRQPAQTDAPPSGPS
jgi:hypothetical protein